MKKNKVAMILGIIFGLSLAYIAYAYFALGLGLAIVGKPLLLYSFYVFVGLVITTIVGAALAKKCIVATRVLLTISVAFLALCLIYAIVELALLGSLTPSAFLQFALQFVILAIGVVATVFAYLAKPNQKQVNIEE